ncbi:hypothetical protein BJ969_003416 [Saccharopolyspora gloriosae]|uniref:Uncharacterized protein n=1 Tax=Saccharopolyspora gloriosae TaxID=455344 RepID=A0A840NJ48_9PSEU|nr:hypothetical protein [Saccharopolyspora gloriosae]
MPSTDVALLLRALGIRVLLLGLLLGVSGAPLAALVVLLAGTGLLARSGAAFPAVSRAGAGAAPEPPGWRVPATGRPDGSAW